MMESSDPSALLAVKPLVISSDPIDGECLSSVLLRTSEANKFGKISHLLDLIGIHSKATEFVPITHADTAPAIAKLLGTSLDAIEMRMHPNLQDDLGRHAIHWFGSPIERRHIEVSLRRFAPRSLEEGQHYPAAWMVRLLDYCPTTMEILVSECPRCLRPLKWRACRSLSKCEKCGGSLFGAPSRILPPGVHDAARLGAALVSPLETVRLAALSSLPKPFNTWAPADALLGLVTMGEAQLSLQHPSDVNDNSGSAECISAGIAFARNWPESLSRFARESTATNNSTSIREGLGPLGKLFEPAAKRTPIRDLIRSTISTSLREALVPVKLFSGAMIDGACRTGMVSALEAAKQLGVCGKTLRKLEGRSNTFLTRHHVKGGAALYDQLAISHLKDILSTSVKSSDCARQIGFPAYCVDAFASAGLLELVTDIDAAIITDGTLITKASMLALWERLRSREVDFEGGVTLREAMKGTGDPQVWVAAFEKLLSGNVRLRIADCDSHSISSTLIVEASDDLHHVSRRTAGSEINGIKVSCQKAAEIIGSTAQFVSAAVKSGILDGEVGTRNSALPLDGVLNFKKQFVLSRELSERFGEDSKRIGVQLREAGYEPATVVNRTRVWRRSDVVKFKHDQIQVLSVSK